MLRLKPSIFHSLSSSFRLFRNDGGCCAALLLQPSELLPRRASARFLDIHQMLSKSSLDKERARLKDEMNRGYFADISEFKQHGGKIAMANKTIIPAMAAVKFPTFEGTYSDGTGLKLPFCFNGSEADACKSDFPKATIMCLSFRASSQAMVESWTTPFINTFKDSTNIQLYEVSFIDSWFLSLKPVKTLLLWLMKKPNQDGTMGVLQKQNVYSFGDTYYFRKELKILNLLTGYIFLLDKFGRIRWQGFGLASEEELSSLQYCTSLLLEEK